MSGNKQTLENFFLYFNKFPRNYINTHTLTGSILRVGINAFHLKHEKPSVCDFPRMVE